MRRTHILHRRDNRRSLPSHHERTVPRDPRVITWLRDGARQILTLDGVRVATVEPYGSARYNVVGDLVEPHTAHVHGQALSARREFSTCDAARLHCEAACLS